MADCPPPPSYEEALNLIVRDSEQQPSEHIQYASTEATGHRQYQSSSEGADNYPLHEYSSSRPTRNDYSPPSPSSARPPPPVVMGGPSYQHSPSSIDRNPQSYHHSAADAPAPVIMTNSDGEEIPVFHHPRFTSGSNPQPILWEDGIMWVPVPSKQYFSQQGQAATSENFFGTPAAGGNTNNHSDSTLRQPYVPPGLPIRHNTCAADNDEECHRLSMASRRGSDDDDGEGEDNSCAIGKWMLYFLGAIFFTMFIFYVASIG